MYIGDTLPETAWVIGVALADTGYANTVKCRLPTNTT
jgi:hypothetical protein